MGGLQVVLITGKSHLIVTPGGVILRIVGEAASTMMVISLAIHRVTVRIRTAREGRAIGVAAYCGASREVAEVMWYQVLQPARIAARVVCGVHLKRRSEVPEVALALVQLLAGAARPQSGPYRHYHQCRDNAAAYIGDHDSHPEVVTSNTLLFGCATHTAPFTLLSSNAFRQKHSTADS